MNTKVKGNNAELEALAYFKRHGYSVALPFGDNDPYDLIIESPKAQVYRVQVRWVSWRNDVATLSLRATSQGRSRPLDFSRIDVFVAWDGKRVYIIPTSHLGASRATFSLRTTAPRNGQKKRVHLAHDYQDALHLVP